MQQSNVRTSWPTSAFTVEVRLELHGNPTRLDVLAGRFNPGDRIALTIEGIELSSPDLHFEKRCKINGALIRLL